MTNLEDFTPVAIFSLVAVLFALFSIILPHLLASKTRGKNTHNTYECGIPPFGSARIKYGIHYYVYALIFIAFDVDVLYLFPVALSYAKGERIHEFYALLSFVVILALAVVYAWGKGVFTWKRKISHL
ncbi:MAG: NADH-quinone oxidoreductase subunit A [Syntrophobacterales bacterium]|nr:NADH-quinone oxidoreductase subunit A [Syntrophobacterales bacterium]